MDTPSRSRNVSGNDGSRGTPFRERAMEERRLKDELLLSATPGLKRRAESRNEEQRVRNDPEELRSYLRELSAVLALREGKNLTDVLVEEDEKAADGSPESGRSPDFSLKDSVFSLLRTDRSRVKNRRVQDPVVIQDATSGASSVEPLGEGYESPVVVEEHVEEQEEEPLQELSGEPESIAPEETNETSSSDESEADEPEPLNKARLRRCLSLYMEREGLRLGKGGWTALQNASEGLLKVMAREMRDEEGRIVPDRQSILRAFIRFNVVSPNATNEDLFEVCCKYLTLEDLNKLEAALFS